MENYRVTLVPEERAALEQLISRGKSASRKLTHARILLLADGVRREGHADDEIVTALGTSLKTIARVRKRFVVEGLEAAIDHRPQPARPDKIKIKINGNVEQKLVKLACTDPPRGRCHWTLQLLADEMVVLGLVAGQHMRCCIDLRPSASSADSPFARPHFLSSTLRQVGNSPAPSFGLGCDHFDP